MGDSGEELVARVAAMVPALRARAAQAEAAGRIPEETIAELMAAGAFRAVVPARFGGHEIAFRYVPRLFREMGRGCVSTAWTMGFLIYHNFQFAHFPEAAQREVWGAGRGFTMAPGQVMPSGEARAVEGGYRLAGRWGYATGILHGDWMLLSTPVVNSGVPGDLRRFYVPVSDCRVLDTWHVSAMRATGSRDVEIGGVFVPEHRQIRVADLREGKAEGLALNPGALYRIPLLTFMSLGAVGPLVGAAEAMMEIVAGLLAAKVRAYSGAQAAAQMSTRVRLAQTSLRLAAMIALYEGMIERVGWTAANGEVFTRPLRAEARACAAFVAKEAQAIVSALAGEAGSRSIYLDSPVQRIQRDVNALATHALFDFDQCGDLHAHGLLGMDMPESAMI